MGAAWVRRVDKGARWFFFRHEGNYHCSPCPTSYKGDWKQGTSHQNSSIYIYEIIGWTAPRPDWEDKYKRVANNRYCTGYKKSAFNHRNVIACANWVRKIDVYARYFFFREEGNYHCSPCPRTYTGHPTTGTARQNSRIYIYRIIGWRQPTWGW